jgi:RNA polymerase sigma-70 factor (ECF subfamily)
LVDNESVEDIIRKAQGGDRDALGHLWRTYNHLLLRYFRGKGMADAEDLSSTVWVEVSTSLNRFQGSEHDFRKWLFTIAARRRIDDIRSIKRRASQEARNKPAPGELQSPDAGEQAEAAASLDRALALVNKLQPDQAEAVLLRVVADLNVSEVAAIMGLREGNVRVLVHRGLARLSEKIVVTDERPRTMSTA